MNRKLSIVLAGGYDTGNLGDHGSLAVFQRHLREHYPESEITLLSRHPDVQFDELYGVRSIVNLDHASREKSKGRIFNGLNEHDDTQHLQRILKELLAADLLVIGNGRLLIDFTLDFMKGPLPYFALLVTLAKFTGTPVMIFSMTIVPVESQIAKQLLKYIVSNASLITVREEPSREELVRIGIRAERITVVPDAGFGIGYENRSKQGIEILKKEGIESGKKFIGINLRYTHFGYKVDDDYFESLGWLCDQMHERLGTDILLISQMYYGIDNKFNDDREVYKAVHRFCKCKGNIHVLKHRYHLYETLSLYQVCEMVFSMRRHGLIFAATQNVPVFALSGEKNTSYCMNELGIRQYQLPISDIDKKSMAQLCHAYEQREKIRSVISGTVPELDAQTSRYIELMNNVI